MTRLLAVAAVLLLSLPGCSMNRLTSDRTLGAIEANPRGYIGQLVAIHGEAVDVGVNDLGMHVLVSTRGSEPKYFRVQYPGMKGPDIVRGDLVTAVGRIKQPGGLVGFGDRMTRTVMVDAISLSGLRDGYHLLSEEALYDRWAAGEPVVLP